MHFGSSTCWQVDGDSCRSCAKRRMAGELGRAVKSATARREPVTLTATALLSCRALHPDRALHRHQAQANLKMRWGVKAKGGWFDLDRGVMYRRGDGEADSNKRRVPAPIPDRLVTHLKRWRRMTMVGPVECAGRLIAKERKGWHRARELAGLPEDVSPHVLKHTCITWLLQNGVPIRQVARFVGMSEKIIGTTFGHHSPDHLNAARTGFSGRSLG